MAHHLAASLAELVEIQHPVVPVPMLPSGNAVVLILAQGNDMLVAIALLDLRPAHWVSLSFFAHAASCVQCSGAAPLAKFAWCMRLAPQVEALLTCLASMAAWMRAFVSSLSSGASAGPRNRPSKPGDVRCVQPWGWLAMPPWPHSPAPAAPVDSRAGVRNHGHAGAEPVVAVHRHRQDSAELGDPARGCT